MLMMIPVASGCLSPAEPKPIRYLRVEAPAPAREAGQSATAPTVRLRTIRAALYLRERVAWRSSPQVVGFHERVRWAEKPEAYVHRALVRELYERRGLTRSQSGSAAALEVELSAFEELLAPDYRVQVALTATLQRPSGDAVFVKTYDVTLPVRGSAPEQMAEAMGAALSKLVRSLGDDVESALDGA
jgi:uncharacterized lipoprotein YmbA